MANHPITRKNACIVVLGDVGRSPRMQYHAQSLLEENFNVNIIGYVESKPIDCLLTSGPKCKIHELSEVPLTTNFPPKLKYVFKTIWQTLSLLIALLSIPRPQFVLVQNPPAVPTLIVCYLYCKIMRSKFVIDWHNYTYSILALSSMESSVIVRLAKWIEKRFGAKSDFNFCVTKAMKDDLLNNWNIEPAVVLYDRPPVQFKPTDVQKKHDLFLKLSKDYPEFQSAASEEELHSSGIAEETAFTQKCGDNVVLKKMRPAILVSSTSWTPDEDFGILLNALEVYEKMANGTTSYPDLLCVITGKGPQKDFYKNTISKLNWEKVSIVTPWLETEDYPTMLSAADLGVCLHWSSSGLDLPMKVVDMFGCGLPVCAVNFKSLNELVIHGENGFVFENYKELSEQLLNWFINFPNNLSIITTKETFQQNLTNFQSVRWKENWTANALPVFNSFI